MSDNFWKKLSYYMGLLPAGAIFGLVVFSANLEIKDLDLWLHLGVGKIIALQHMIPTVDILSFTMKGHHWTNHEWLFQIIVHNIFSMWGADGLLKMQAVIVTITMMLLLFLGFNREKQFVTNIMLCLVYLVYQQRFTLRPDLFSLLFFVMYIYILALHIDKKWAIWVLIIIQILWTNIHGFFFFGPLFILVGIVSEWIKRNLRLPFEWNESGCLTDDEYKRLKVVLVFVSAVCLINPHGLKGALYPFEIFFSFSGEDKIFFKYIQELQKPVLWKNILDTRHFIYFKILILMSAISFIFNRRRIDISALFLWIIFLVFSLNAARNTAFFAIAAYLAFITNLLYISSEDVIPLRFTGKKFACMTAILINFLFLFWIFDYGESLARRSYYDFDEHKMKKESGGISLMMYSHKAVDFLIENKIQGDFFNDFNSGAYLIGRTHPDIKVFIDGRTELYGGTFFKKYHDCLDDESGELFDKLDKEYGFTGAFLSSSTTKVPRALLKVLHEDEKWIPVYFDHDAIIFLKDIEENKTLIAKLKVDVENWKTEEADLVKIGANRVRPYRYYRRAYALEIIGKEKAAIAECKEAVKIAPGYLEPYVLMGKLYGRNKEYKKAFESFRYAAIISPYKQKIRMKLALALYDMGEYEGSIKQYKEMEEMWPDDPRILYSLSKVYAKNKQYNMVMDPIKRGFDVNPKSVGDSLMIADLIVEQGEEYDLSEEIYRFVLQSDPKSPVIFKKMAGLFKAKGDINKAKDHFNRAISFDPDNKKLKGEFNALFNVLEP